MKLYLFYSFLLIYLKSFLTQERWEKSDIYYILCGWYEQCCNVRYYRIVTKWAITKTISPLSVKIPTKISGRYKKYRLLIGNIACVFAYFATILFVCCPLSGDIVCVIARLATILLHKQYWLPACLIKRQRKQYRQWKWDNINNILDKLGTKIWWQVKPYN